MEKFDFVELAKICLTYLGVISSKGSLVDLFRESFGCMLTVEDIRSILLDLDDEHAPGMDSIINTWMLDMVKLTDIWNLPLSRNEVLYLMLRIECACDLLPSLCRSDPQVHPNQRFFLSISSATEREAVLWALTSFWNHIRLFYFHIAAERMHSNLLHTP